jgi:hypothetical protein
LFIVIILFLVGRFGFASRYSIALFSPGTQIDELTTLRTKRTVGVIFPRYLNLTDRAFDTRSHVRESQDSSLPEAKSFSRSAFLIGERPNQKQILVLAYFISANVSTVGVFKLLTLCFAGPRSAPFLSQALSCSVCKGVFLGTKTNRTRTSQVFSLDDFLRPSLFFE